MSDGNGRAVYKVYRLGGDVAQALDKALAAHRERYGDPAAVTVHPSEVAAARLALDAQGLGLDVAGSGGCLVGEVWLALADGDGDAQEEGRAYGPGSVTRPAGASLLRRVEAARGAGGEMTPERAREKLRQLALFEEEV